MAYTETHKVSYGKRVGNSFRGIGTGFLMIIAASVLLWWNEGRAVKTAKMLHSASNEAVEASLSSVDPQNDGKLIHAIDVIACEQTLSDPTFGVSAVTPNLRSNVEYYQYVESTTETTKDKVGGGQEVTTTYNYNKNWTSSPVDSDSFKDPDYRGKNVKPAITPAEVNLSASDVKLGAYQLTPSLVSSIPCNSPVDINLSEELVAQLNKEIRAFRGVSVASDYVHVNAGTIYIGLNPSMPELGDVRITFTKSQVGPASILAVADGNSFKAYEHKNGKKLCSLVMGEKTLDEMIEAKEKANTMWLWIIRIVGILLCCAGFKGIVGFLVTVLKVLPFLANIANVGVNLVCNVVGFVWSLIIILIAWFAYRPLLSIGLLAVVVALIYLLSSKSKKAKPAADAPVAETPAE